VACPPLLGHRGCLPVPSPSASSLGPIQPPPHGPSVIDWSRPASRGRSIRHCRRRFSERCQSGPAHPPGTPGLHRSPFGNRKQDVSGSISDRRCRDRWRPAANRLTTAARGGQALASIMRDPRWTHPDRRMQHHQPWPRSVSLARYSTRSPWRGLRLLAS
jgi:hypothetical protein